YGARWISWPVAPSSRLLRTWTTVNCLESEGSTTELVHNDQRSNCTPLAAPRCVRGSVHIFRPAVRPAGVGQPALVEQPHYHHLPAPDSGLVRPLFPAGNHLLGTVAALRTP